MKYHHNLNPAFAGHKIYPQNGDVIKLCNPLHKPLTGFRIFFK